MPGGAQKARACHLLYETGREGSGGISTAADENKVSRQALSVCDKNS